MRLTLFIFNFIICSFFFSQSLIAQRTLYTTGRGADINWLNVNNWSEDPDGVVITNRPPSDRDHVVIRHEILHKVYAGYIHYGNITVEREGSFIIYSGGGVSDPYIFAGDTCLIRGRLTTSSDFHHQIFGSDGDGILIFEHYAIAEIGDDLILNAYGHTLMNNADCGAGGSFDDLYFKGTHSTLCGNGRFVIPDAIRAWNDNNQEIFPSSLQTDNQICEGFLFYGTLQECVADSVAPFPIELLSFEAEVSNEGVELNWATIWEVNNSFFTLERSKDGEEFETIANIRGALNSDDLEIYQFNDYQPLEGKSFYRLKQTDLDGKSTYSGLVEVNVMTLQASLRAYPNPFQGNGFNIAISGFQPNETVWVTMRDLMGRPVYRAQYQTDSHGFIHQSLSLNLASGHYILTCQSMRHTLNQRMIKS